MNTPLQHFHLRLFLLAALALAALVLAGCGGSSDDAKPASPTAAQQAATLVSQGKSDLSSLLQSDQESRLGTFFDTVNKFETAYGLNPGNAEAAFYSGFLQLIIFLDGAQTTALLSSLGLQRLRTEIDQCFGYDDPDDQSPDATPCPFSPFEADDAIIVGGTDSYVDLSFADALVYPFGTLPSALEASAARLEGLSGTFSSNFNAPKEDGTGTEVVNFDYTEAQVLAALGRLEAAALRLPTLVTYTGADDFLTANTNRDPATGEFVVDESPDDVPNATTEGWLKNGISGAGTQPAQANAGGLAAVRTGFVKTFTALSNAINDLLNETQGSTDLITLKSDVPRFEAEADLERFDLGLVQAAATNLSASFADTTGGTAAPLVTVYNPVAFITSWDTCLPLTGGTMETFRNLDADRWGSSWQPLNTIDTLDVPVTPNDPAGAAPGTAGAGNFYFSVVVVDPATLVGGISIFSRPASAGPFPNGTGVNAAVGVSNGTDILPVATDEGSGAQGNFGISLAKAYFDGGTLPATGPVTLYIRVSGNTADFKVYAWDDSYTAETVPIFLRGGGGRRFQIRLDSRATRFSAGALLSSAASAFDNANRSTLVLDDPATPGDDSSLLMTTGTLESALNAIVPVHTYTIFERGLPNSGFWDMFQDDLEVEAPEVETRTIGVPSPVTVPYPVGGSAAFCAYPYEFGTDWEVEGGFELNQ